MSYSRSIYLFLAAIAVLTPSRAAAEDQFTVAAVIPLSGRSAEYGVAARNGFSLAQKNHPELFTHLRFLYEDSLYDGKTSITAFQKFTAVDGADLVFVWGHGPVEAVAPVAEAAHRPLVVVSGQRDVAVGKKYVIRFCSPHDAFADALLQELRRRGRKKLAIVKTELGFMNDTIEALKKGLNPQESLEIAASYQPGETDFLPTVTKLKTMNYDLLGLFIGEDQMPVFMSRMALVKLNPPLFGTHTLGGKNSITAIQGQSAEAFFSANHVDENFYRQYSAEFGSDIQITWAANAYDFAMLTAKLFGTGVKPAVDQIAGAYRAIKDNSGVTGSHSYVENEQFGAGFVFPVVIKTITKDGVLEAAPHETQH